MTEELQMPTFDFSQLSFQSDEEVEAYEKENGGAKYVDKYLKPGRHEVVIADVSFKGRCKNDDTWFNLQVTYEGAGGKTANAYLQVPTQDIKYGPKGTLYPYQNLKKFCQAVGYPISTVKDVKSVVKSAFAQPAKSLVKKPLAIELGYNKGHVKYVSKGEYHLVDRDGNAVTDNDGVPRTFADRDSAILYANSNKIAIDEYPQVLTYETSAMAQKQDFKEDTSW